MSSRLSNLSFDNLDLIDKFELQIFDSIITKSTIYIFKKVT